MWWLAAVKAESISHVDSGELALIKRLEELRTQAIELLNETDGYKMATAVSDNVADVLKFFDDLGAMFRNGTLGTYMCRKRHFLPEDCDIYALPNGSVPLKKSVSKLMFDIFNAMRLKYGDLGQKKVERELVGNWFPPSKGQTVSFLRPSPREDLVDAVSDNIVYKIWGDYEDLFAYDGLRDLEKSTWRNNTERNLSTWDDFKEYRTTFLTSPCLLTRVGWTEEVLKVLYALMGPHCANESEVVWETERCLTDFVIRYNNYDEAIYKTFAKDISTLIYHELTVVGFCFGITGENDDERAMFEEPRNNLSEQVREVMKQLHDARSVLSEEPPTTPSTTTVSTTPTTRSGSSQSPTSGPFTLSLIERVEERRSQAITLLNETDAYEMATTMSHSVADTLKFYDTLGTLFRNGSRVHVHGNALDVD